MAAASCRPVAAGAILPRRLARVTSQVLHRSPACRALRSPLLFRAPLPRDERDHGLPQRRTRTPRLARSRAATCSTPSRSPVCTVPGCCTRWMRRAFRYPWVCRRNESSIASTPSYQTLLDAALLCRLFLPNFLYSLYRSDVPRSDPHARKSKFQLVRTFAYRHLDREELSRMFCKSMYASHDGSI